MSLFEHPGYEWLETYFLVVNPEFRLKVADFSAVGTMKTRFLAYDIRCGIGVSKEGVYSVVMPAEKPQRKSSKSGKTCEISGDFGTKSNFPIPAEPNLKDLSDENFLDHIILDAPDDGCALEVQYSQGPHVCREMRALYKTNRHFLTPHEQDIWNRIINIPARYEVLLFQNITSVPVKSELENSLDPGALLGVLEILMNISHGTVLDPQSGTVWDCG